MESAVLDWDYDWGDDEDGNGCTDGDGACQKPQGEYESESM